jgi:hypothetical protein
MKQEQFLEIVRKRMDKSLQVLIIKAKEYARDGDRLSNFKKAAALQSITPEEALFAMLAKHLVSLSELTDDLRIGKDWPHGVWEEKITDSINYLYLLEALVKERYGWA